MPFDWNTFGAIAGQNTLNVGMQHLTNVKNRKFAREMYGRQREDALADWAMQNEYNSPRAQMQRFQEAGLNPNLIYGQANYGADIRSSSAGSGNAAAPGQRLVGEYMDVRQRSAQLDLVAQNMELIKSQIEKNKAQTTATLVSVPGIDINVKRGAVKLGLEEALAGYQLQSAGLGVERLKVGNRKTEADIERIMTEIPILQDRNRREQLANDQSIRESIARILKMSVEKENISTNTARVNHEIHILDQQLRGLNFENGIKAIELELRKDGIHPGTPGWLRAIQVYVERFRDKVLKK